ncbi:MAG: septum formation initiator family protein [Ruminococcus sp.]|nr:septum formation initiator family protein [Ruminococcus sp.]
MAKKPKDRTYKKASKALKKKDNKSFVISKPLSAFALVCFVVYSVIMIISQQIQIADIKKESEELSEKITAAKQQNDEYVRLLSADDEAAYMERIAIEKLGYAYPNERRFYIINAD